MKSEKDALQDAMELERMWRLLQQDAREDRGRRVRLPQQSHDELRATRKNPKSRL